jgi:hypothetical protein
MAIEIMLFGAALCAIWWIRRRQLQSLKQQALHLRRFAEQVTNWRSRPDVPDIASKAIEELFHVLPFDRKTVRRTAVSILTHQFEPPPTLEDNPFWQARQSLSEAQETDFDFLLTTYFAAWTHSDWFWGGFLRRTRFGGLSYQTRAEVALETAFSRHTVRVAHAA